jgi:capsular polysaccharide biosynthesis protein
MPESFEMFRYLDHLRGRWMVMAVAVGVAGALALVAGLLTPAQYTATARILIESPAAGDLRASMAVSPVYLESLKSYASLASGDRLFADAIEHLHLQRSRSIEQLKQAVLKVTIPRSTKVLEIAATLPDPRQAQALANYIAEQTVALARDLALEADRDALADAQKQRDEARAQLEPSEPAAVNSAAGSANAARSTKSESLQLAIEAAQMHLQEVRSTAGYRAERLKIFDPGVVPERPSWPNIPLILLAAVLVALAASLLYVTFEFNYRMEKSAAPRAVAPLARVKNLND